MKGYAAKETAGSSDQDMHTYLISGEGEPGKGEAGETPNGTTTPPNLNHLDGELQQQARRNWGRLPGQLRTEILQGAGKKSHPEYTQRIKSYFDEITKPAK